MVVIAAGSKANQPAYKEYFSCAIGYCPYYWTVCSMYLPYYLATFAEHLMYTQLPMVADLIFFCIFGYFVVNQRVLLLLASLPPFILILLFAASQSVAVTCKYKIQVHIVWFWHKFASFFSSLKLLPPSPFEIKKINNLFSSFI